jgi:hypothetical protein
MAFTICREIGGEAQQLGFFCADDSTEKLRLKTPGETIFPDLRHYTKRAHWLAYSEWPENPGVVD